ncbi:MAG: endonuclease/exonuclease/phosphatase family protein [Bacteroidetes bacterium]|nr:endonuclease/exonuclease/phosphatase family protein [Bacteroidota bacterium]
MRLALAGITVAILAAGCATPVPENLPKPAVPVQELVAQASLKGRAIVGYNVENLFDTKDDPATHDEDFLPDGELHWNTERYRHKLDQLARAISWAGDGLPAVIGLAEVENAGVVNDLARTPPLRGAAYTVVHFDSPDERGIDVALLVRKDLASVAAKEPLPVDLGRDRTRDVLYVLLKLADGEMLHVLMNHWPSRGEGVRGSAPKRMAAARVVRRKVDALLKNDPKAKIIIMGDFNDTPDDASMQQGLRAACNTGTQADLFDLMCMDQAPGSGSFQYGGNWEYLDQMIVSAALLNGPGIRLEKASVCHDPRLLFRNPKFGPSPDKTYSGGHYKGGFSDHLPVVAWFQ